MKPSVSKTNKQRLQVVLSHSGVCSRRKAMTLIFDGRVSVNGQIVTEPSFGVDALSDQVCLDGEPVGKKAFSYLLVNKPRGYMTTRSDPHAEKIITELLPQEYQHLFPVGRLDKESEGLILMTNDGDVAYKLSHPSFNIDKTYFVEMQGALRDYEKSHLEKGVSIDNKKTSASRIFRIKYDKNKTSFYITIHEGRKRQIRRMLEVFHHDVLVLRRVNQGPLALGNLAAGEFRPLTQQEISALKRL